MVRGYPNWLPSHPPWKFLIRVHEILCATTVEGAAGQRLPTPVHRQRALPDFGSPYGGESAPRECFSQPVINIEWKNLACCVLLLHLFRSPRQMADSILRSVVMGLSLVSGKCLMSNSTSRPTMDAARQNGCSVAAQHEPPSSAYALSLSSPSCNGHQRQWRSTASGVPSPFFASGDGRSGSNGSGHPPWIIFAATTVEGSGQRLPTPASREHSPRQSLRRRIPGVGDGVPSLPCSRRRFSSPATEATASHLSPAMHGMRQRHGSAERPFPFGQRQQQR
nr:hypothetical protein Iba_chr06bCG11990 [Ipomoea batatas]